MRKQKTCLSQTDFTILYDKSLCNLNLRKPNTCLNGTNYPVPKGFDLDRFYSICFFLYILRWFSIYNIRNGWLKFRDKNCSIQLVFTNLCLNNFFFTKLLLNAKTKSFQIKAINCWGYWKMQCWSLFSNTLLALQNCLYGNVKLKKQVHF